MSQLGVRFVLLLSAIAAALSFFVMKDASDFFRGIVTGIWIGLLLLGVIYQGKILKRKF